MEVINFLSTHLWESLALGASCLVAFSITQMWKVSLPVKPSGLGIYCFCAAITSVFAALAWSNASTDVLEIVTVAVFTGAGWPLLILLWFAVASKFAPKTAERLKGSNGELTILPWVNKRK